MDDGLVGSMAKEREKRRKGKRGGLSEGRRRQGWP